MKRGFSPREASIEAKAKFTSPLLKEITRPLVLRTFKVGGRVDKATRRSIISKEEERATFKVKREELKKWRGVNYHNF